MKIIRPAFLLGGAVIGLLFLSPRTACSQSIPPHAYLFVEVKDTAGKAVDDATVSLSIAARDAKGAEVLNAKTNKDGFVAQANFDLWQPARHHYELRVSKPGWLTSEHALFLYQHRPSGRHLRIGEEFPSGAGDAESSVPRPVRVVLLRTAADESERQAFEVRERKRRLLLAVKRGDAAGLRALLEAGGGADTTDDGGVPAIAWAAFAGDAETIKTLLAAGADVRRPNTPGHQALLIYLTEGIHRGAGAAAEVSAVERHEEVVRKLVEAGAGVNAQSPHRGTVLNRAIAHATYSTHPPHALTVETIRLLVAAGANVNAAETDGRTPLMSAAAQNSAPMIKLLLGAGAAVSLNAKDNQGRTALTHSPGSRHGGSSLEATKVLLTAGANVVDVDAEGRTPLMLAAQSHFVELVNILLKAGAAVSVNARDRRGKTALLYVESDLHADASAELVGILAAAGADVNAADENGQTALMRAAEGYHGRAIGVLLGGGARASVNAKDKRGRTALMSAAHTGYVDRIKLLLEAGASLKERDAQEQTALLYAARGQAGSEAVKVLLAAGADINDFDGGGQTALMLAAESGSLPVLKTLLDDGALVNAKDRRGRTALMWAVEPENMRDERLEKAKLLLASGADPGIKDNQGQTALMIAKQVGHEAIVKLLEEAQPRGVGTDNLSSVPTLRGCASS